jgi:hypothetical protein
MRRRLSRATRELVALRASFRCEYCQSPEFFCPDTFSVDHILPLAHGGTDDLENLAFACQGCNGPKSAARLAKDPDTEEFVPLFHPRQDMWKDHFRWTEDFLRIEGITPTGRATLIRMDLNREGVVNLRGLLRRSGENHPPAETMATLTD